MKPTGKAAHGHHGQQAYRALGPQRPGPPLSSSDSASIDAFANANATASASASGQFSSSSGSSAVSTGSSSSGIVGSAAGLATPRHAVMSGSIEDMASPAVTPETAAAGSTAQQLSPFSRRPDACEIQILGSAKPSLAAHLYPSEHHHHLRDNNNNNNNENKSNSSSSSSSSRSSEFDNHSESDTSSVSDQVNEHTVFSNYADDDCGARVNRRRRRRRQLNNLIDDESNDRDCAQRSETEFLQHLLDISGNPERLRRHVRRRLAHQQRDDDAGRLQRMGTHSVAVRRAPAIMLTVILELGVGVVVSLFSTTISAYPVIVSYMPLISSVCGNIGLQSSAATLRALVTGNASNRNARHIWRTLKRESKISALLGLWICAGLCIVIWMATGIAGVGIVAGTSILLSAPAAAVMGALAPLLLKLIGLDPALCAGPFETALEDIVGIAIYLGLAALVLPSVPAVPA